LKALKGLDLATQGVALWLPVNIDAQALKGRYVSPFQGFCFCAIFTQGFALCYLITGFQPYKKITPT